MNNDLQTKVIEWVEITAQKVESFTVEQLPLFIQEYLQWKFLENLFDIGAWVAFVILFAVIPSYWIIKLWKYSIDLVKKEDNPFIMVPALLTAVIVIPLIINTPLREAKDCVKIKVAPKVYLLDQAASLVKDK